jgi:Lrp/AsnC family leucine-responsive transcriptional regulator
MVKERRNKAGSGYVLDAIDRKILALLQDNAKMAQAVVAKRVGLTAPSIHDRVRKLEGEGYIRGYVAVLDPHKMGQEITAFVEVFVEHPKFEESFIKAVSTLDEVLECHHITGEFSILLKIRVSDMAAFRRLLIEHLNTLRGVRQTRTVMVLATAKEQRRLRVDATVDPESDRRRRSRTDTRNERSFR